jgi:DNA-binding GntR family transcriptional regulator
VDIRRLTPVQPRTMVEQAAEAVVAAAARGLFLPGDRLVEAEIARDLGISRVPVREALRLLESQGIVVSTPYKGMRLMQVTNDGVAQLMRVRAALESLALRELPIGHDGTAASGRCAPLQAGTSSSRSSAIPRRVVAADEAFHGELCRASGNAVLLACGRASPGNSRRVGARPRRALPTASSPMHRQILDRLSKGDVSGALDALATHLGWSEDFDFEAAVARRRATKKG